MCIIICFATVMSFNSKNKLNVQCMDYTAISSMTFMDENHILSTGMMITPFLVRLSVV